METIIKEFQKLTDIQISARETETIEVFGTVEVDDNKIIRIIDFYCVEDSRKVEFCSIMSDIVQKKLDAEFC